MEKRYNDFSLWLTRRFGCRVQKLTVDAGLTCPNRDGTLSMNGCIYCNARGAGSGAFQRGLSIREQVLAGKIALAKRYKAKKFIVYFQSYTNTYAPLPQLRQLYESALYVEDVIGLSIGTRPDCVDGPILDLLEGYASEHMIWVEYGLQSADDATLARINRGHDFACFKNAVRATQNRGIRVCAHVILGLPGETRNRMMATADAIAGLDIDGVKLHLLYIVKGTPLDELYMQGGYTCLEQAAYVDLVCDFLERLPPRMVIQRLTSDPHSWELRAPRWSLAKRRTLDMIQETLDRRDSRQGMAWKGAC